MELDKLAYWTGVSAICIVASAPSWAAEFGNPANWPQFRGPEGTGVVEGGFPSHWSTNQNVAWRTTVPGAGWSSPIVWGNKIVVTAVVNEGESEPPKKGLYLGGERPTPSSATHHWMVDCLDLDSGHLVWQKEVHQGRPATSKHLKNSYASETPVTDAEHVYADFGNVGTFCLDHAGRVVWSQPWPPHKTRNGWGTAASPVLYGDRLFLVHDNEEHSLLLALDKHTGRSVWQVDRDEKSNWATPYLWANDRRTELVVPGRNKVRSYSLEGKILWELGGMSSIVIPTPFAHGGLLYVTSGYVVDAKRPVFAIRPGAAGDITLRPGETNNTAIAWWQKTAGPYNPSPVAYGDYLYVLYDFGFFSCFDARNGQEVYGRQRLNTEGGSAFTASPWACGGKIYCLSEDGDTFVVQAGPSFQLLGINRLNEMCLATPALVKDRLILRTATALYCFR